MFGCCQHGLVYRLTVCKSLVDGKNMILTFNLCFPSFILLNKVTKELRKARNV